MGAEVVALRYYRALRDGSGDALTAEVAGRILADEERHVRFHRQRLGGEFATLPSLIRPAVAGAWHVLLFGASVVVVYDHGRALRRLGVGRREFLWDVGRLFTAAIADVRTERVRELVPVG